MTNKEKYKQAFSVLHTSDISEGEVKYMAKLKKQQKMKLAAAAIAVCVIVGGTGTAYAKKCRRNPANYPALDAR